MRKAFVDFLSMLLLIAAFLGWTTFCVRVVNPGVRWLFGVGAEPFTGLGFVANLTSVAVWGFVLFAVVAIASDNADEIERRARRDRKAS